MNENPLFFGLIMSLSTSAMAQMGKMPNPMTGKIEKDMAGARQTIDLVNMLAEKTKNNLSPKEDKILKDTLTSLQLTFVNDQKSSSPEEKKEEAPGEESKPDDTSQNTDAPSSPEQDENKNNG